MKLRILLLLISLAANVYFATISIQLMIENISLKTQIAKIETKPRDQK